MKYKTVNQKLEDLALHHLNVTALHLLNEHEKKDVSVHQIKKALKNAYLMGERAGYKHGFNDAKTACNCDLTHDIHK